MNLADICTIADSYYIAENKLELNQEYLSSSELIHSDGTFSHHINKDGYIVIYDIVDANYIVFIDQSGDLFLGIYRYIQDIKFKEIIDNMNVIRNQTGMHKHNASVEVTDIEPNRECDPVLKDAADDLVNINNMICTECGSKDFVEPFAYDSDKNITCQCKTCSTIYKLSPSKYYAIKSKTIFSNVNDILITREVK